MTAPDLPAELKAALDARLQGLSRSDAAARAASISKTYRDGGGSGRDPHRDRCARLCAGADARDLCRGDRKPERAAAKSRPDFAPKSLLDVGAGPGTASWAAAEAFPSLQGFALAGCQQRLARAGARSRRRQRAPARDRLPPRRSPRRAGRRAKPADLVVASYMIGEIGEAERRALAELMWAKDPRHAAGRRARHARGLCADHRAARAIDRGRRACRGALPARRQMSACCARLVPFHPAPAALARAQADQGRRASVRGREIQLCRADPRADRAASRPRAGAARRRQGRGDRETLHARRSRHRKSAPPRQGGLRPRPALAMGRRGDEGRLTPRALNSNPPCGRPRDTHLVGQLPRRGSFFAVCALQRLAVCKSGIYLCDTVRLGSPVFVVSSGVVCHVDRLDRSRRPRHSRSLRVRRL